MSYQRVHVIYMQHNWDVHAHCMCIHSIGCTCLMGMCHNVHTYSHNVHTYSHSYGVASYGVATVMGITVTICMYVVTICVTVTICMCVMGWLRLVRSLKLKVSLAEYSLFDRALLQKRPTILRRLLIVATPYRVIMWLDDATEMWQNMFCVWDVTQVRRVRRNTQCIYIVTKYDVLRVRRDTHNMMFHAWCSTKM